MRSSTVRAAVPVWLVSEGAAVVIVSWSCTEAALLILAADSCSVPVFLALKALRETAVSMVELAVFELALEEQPFVNERVDLRR